MFTWGQPLTIEIDYLIRQQVEGLAFGVAIHNSAGVLCYGSNTHLDLTDLGPAPPAGTVRFQAKRLDLVQGTYLLDVAANSPEGRDYDYLTQVASFAVRGGPEGDAGIYRPPHHWSLRPRKESP